MNDTLARSNPYMRDPEMRDRLVFRSVATSSAVEGIRAPFKDKAAVVGKARQSKAIQANHRP